MAVSIRLRRTGANKDVSFRVVAADRQAPRDGRYLEVLGWYDPKKTGRNFQINVDRIAHWRANGARISETVESLLSRNSKEASQPVS